jgi:hypothetical protein
MTLERYLSVKVRNWRISYFNSKRAVITCFILFLCIFSLNIHLVFTINYVKPLNYTFDGGCYSDKMHNIWQFVHLYMYNILPFVLLTVINSLLIFRTFKSGRHTGMKRVKAKKKMMSVFVIIMTLFFILMTLPSSIAGGYFLRELLSTEIGNTILFLCDCFAFSYHALNIFVLYHANKQFQREFKEILIIVMGNNDLSSGTTKSYSTSNKY